MLRQRPERLDPRIDAFPVADEWSRERVRAIVRAFLRGYNAMAVARAPDDVHGALAGVDPYFRAFGYEGAAMGFGPWALRRRVGYDAFEATAAALSPATVYQNYVGWGWWLGLWYRARPTALARRVDRLHPLYRVLVYEGMGFRAGFMSGGDPRVLRRFAAFGAAARHVGHQGFGRSLWFSRMGDPEGAGRVIETLHPDVRGDAYSGLGLGCAYSWLDRAGELPGIADGIPAAHRDDFMQGAAFGWEARKRSSPELFDRLTAGLPAAPRAVAIVRETAATVSDYQAWRAATREAMTVKGAAHVH